MDACDVRTDLLSRSSVFAKFKAIRHGDYVQASDRLLPGASSSAPA